MGYPMRFIHTADWHFNSNRKKPSYLQRFEAVMDEIMELMVQHEIDTLVLAGDLCEFRMNHAEQQFIVRKFSEWDHAGITVIMIDGNHDRIDANRHSSLDIFKTLHKEGRLPNVTTITHEPQVVEHPHALFMCIPWFGAKTKKELLSKLDPKIKNQDKPVIVVCHEHFKGAKTAQGWTSKDRQLLIPKSKHITYWALGDIHKRQRMASNAFYPGSPFQVDFGEVLPKGVALVDTDNPTKPKFLKLKAAEEHALVTLSPDQWDDGTALKVAETAFDYRTVVTDADDVDQTELPEDAKIVDGRSKQTTLNFSSVDFSLEDYMREVLTARGQLSEKEIDEAVEMGVKFMEHAQRVVGGHYETRLTP